MPFTGAWNSLVEGGEGCISPSSKAVAFMINPRKFMQHMDGINSYMLDHGWLDCWADPVVHLLALKNSMTGVSNVHALWFSKQ